MEPSKANAIELETIHTEELTRQGLLGRQINASTKIPQVRENRNTELKNNDQEINMGYKLKSEPANLGGCLLREIDDHNKVQDVLAKAKEQYKFLDPKLIAVAERRPDAGHLESFPVGEPGTMEPPTESNNFRKPQARPAGIPMDRNGLAVYNVDGITPQDIAGDALHQNAIANHTREILSRSIKDDSPQYLQLKNTALDYGDTILRGQGEASARQNAVDSAMRGYVIGQWPKEVNDKMKWTDQQKQLLDNLKNYMHTGKQK